MPAHLDVDKRTSPYEIWVGRWSEALRLLLLQRDHCGPDGDFNGVSLVSYQQNPSAGSPCQRRVEIINWQNKSKSVQPSCETGRVISMDADNRLKVPVNVGAFKDPIDFRSRHPNIIWRDTGVKVVKAQWKRDQQQSTMPKHMLTVLDMFREAEGDSRQPTNDPCIVCNEVDSKQLPIRKAVRCCLCMLSSHQHCVASLQGMLKEALKSAVQVKARPAGADNQSLSSSSSSFGPQPSLLPLKLPESFRLPDCFAPTRRDVGCG